MRWTSLVLAALCAACGPGGESRPADTIVINGKIFTGVPEAGDVEALAIRDGRILAAGSKEDVRAYAGRKTEVIDAGGRRVVPGLTDAHAHVAARPEGVWLEPGGGPVPDPDPHSVLNAVRAEAGRPEGKGWIYAVIGPRVLEDASLRREALDEASPGRPVMLVAYTGHGTILNSRALRTLSVNEDHDPPGGWCERDGVGRCTGLIREMMEFAARRKLRMSVPVSRTAEAYREAAETYLRWGVTAVHEMALSHTVERTVAALQEAQISVRWSIYRAAMLKGSMDEAWNTGFSGIKMPARVHHAGIKWILDGTPIERDAASRADYADRKGWRGRINFTEGELKRLLGEGLKNEEQLALHAGGDRTLDMVFQTMRDIAPPERWRSQRVRIEHGDSLQPDLQEQAAELGVVLVQNPLHFNANPAVATRVSEDLRPHFMAVKSSLEAGVPLAIGSDAEGPASNPWLNIMLAATHPINPGEALSVRQALAAYTSGGAYAEKQETERGTLAEGRLADLAILSQDVLEVPLEELPKTRSVLTMIGGEVVHRTDDMAASSGAD